MRPVHTVYQANTINPLTPTVLLICFTQIQLIVCKGKFGGMVEMEELVEMAKSLLLDYRRAKHYKKPHYWLTNTA